MINVKLQRGDREHLQSISSPQTQETIEHLYVYGKLNSYNYYIIYIYKKDLSLSFFLIVGLKTSSGSHSSLISRGFII